MSPERDTVPWQPVTCNNASRVETTDGSDTRGCFLGVLLGKMHRFGGGESETASKNFTFHFLSQKKSLATNVGLDRQQKLYRCILPLLEFFFFWANVFSSSL